MPGIEQLGEVVVARTTGGERVCVGTVISYCPYPTYEIETASGNQVSWVASLCTPATPQEVAELERGRGRGAEVGPSVPDMRASDLAGCLRTYRIALEISDARLRAGKDNTYWAATVVRRMEALRKAVAAEMGFDPKDTDLIDGAVLMALRMSQPGAAVMEVEHA